MTFYKYTKPTDLAF